MYAHMWRRSTTPVSSCSAADRKLDRDAAVGQLLPRRPEHAEKVGALAVEHVDEENARELLLLGALPHARGVDLDSHHAAEHDDDALDDAQRRERVGLEARVARRVDQVDLPVFPLEVAERAREGHRALLLVLVPVRDRRPLLDATEPVDLLGLVEQRLDERRLPDAAVAGDCDVANLRGLGGRHAGRVLLGRFEPHRIPAGVDERCGAPT